MLSKTPREAHKYRFLVAIDNETRRYGPQSARSLSVLVAVFTTMHGVFLDKTAVRTTNHLYLGCI